MIYKNISIINKYVNFQNVSLDFSKYGIYQIMGDNGIGKSTLIKSLLFDDYKPYFSNDIHARMYNERKDLLIGYVSQTEVSTSDNVYDYITKNSKVDAETLNKLLNSFNLDDIRFQQPHYTLSGGEKMKLSIVSNLLKNTPYLFLDEPTNSLDDKSVAELIVILNKYRFEKSIIIVSHDPRLADLSDFNIYITDDKIYQDDLTEFKNNTSTINNYNRDNMLIKVFKGMRFKNMSLWVLILILSLILLSLLNHFIFFTNYASNDLPNKNEILVQSVDCVYSDLNETYVLEEGLTINESDYYNLVYYESIPDLATLNGVETLYLTDYQYYSTYYRDYYNEESNESFYIFSVPSKIYSSEKNLGFMSNKELLYLEVGRLPRDGGNEVAISINILNSFYHFNIATNQILNIDASPIGDSIIIDGKSYEIVGITLKDIGIVSYNDNDEYGVYKYNEDTYHQFMEKQIDFLTEEGSNLNVDSMLIITEAGFERNVLNKIIKQFPGNNFNSNYFVLVFDKSLNKSLNNTMFLVNIVISVILSIICMIGINSKVREHYGKIIDYQNYYLCENTIKLAYAINMVIYYFISIILALIITYLIGLYTNMYSIIIRHLLLAYSIIILPNSILTYIKLKNVDC